MRQLELQEMKKELEEFGLEGIYRVWDTPVTTTKDDPSAIPVRLLQKQQLQRIYTYGTCEEIPVSYVKASTMSPKYEIREGDLLYYGSRFGGRQSGCFVYVTKELLDSLELHEQEASVYASAKCHIIRGDVDGQGLAMLYLLYADCPESTKDLYAKLWTLLSDFKRNGEERELEQLCRSLYRSFKNRRSWVETINASVSKVKELESEE